MTYPGGKNGAGVYQTIINQIPPHDVYVEAFAGSAAVFRNKRPARVSALIDKTLQRDLIGPVSPGVSMLQGDALKLLPMLVSEHGPGTFVYADPPYVRSSRKSERDIYEHEMTDDDHYELVHILRMLDCNVMVSGYSSVIYETGFEDWRRVEFQAMTRRGLATEVLWMNYPEPTILHDPSYIGDDYRERERIKRKAQRWARRFEALEPRERCAVLSVVLARPDTAATFQAMIDHRQDGRCDPTSENDEERFQ